MTSCAWWSPEKRAKVLLTLLQGKLVNIYIDLNNETKADLAEVNKALMKKVGLIKDSLVAGKEFMVHSQLQGETMECFVEELSRLFSHRSIYVEHFVATISDGGTPIHRSAATFT